MSPAKCSGDGPDGLWFSQTNSWQEAADSSFKALFAVENAQADARVDDPTQPQA